MYKQAAGENDQGKRQELMAQAKKKEEEAEEEQGLADKYAQMAKDFQDSQAQNQAGQDQATDGSGGQQGGSGSGGGEEGGGGSPPPPPPPPPPPKEDSEEPKEQETQPETQPQNTEIKGIDKSQVADLKESAEEKAIQSLIEKNREEREKLSAKKETATQTVDPRVAQAHARLHAVQQSSGAPTATGDSAGGTNNNATTSVGGQQTALALSSVGSVDSGAGLGGGVLGSQLTSAGSNSRPPLRNRSPAFLPSARPAVGGRRPKFQVAVKRPSSKSVVRRRTRRSAINFTGTAPTPSAPIAATNSIDFSSVFSKIQSGQRRSPRAVSNYSRGSSTLLRSSRTYGRQRHSVSRGLKAILVKNQGRILGSTRGARNRARDSNSLRDSFASGTKSTITARREWSRGRAQSYLRHRKNRSHGHRHHHKR